MLPLLLLAILTTKADVPRLTAAELHAKMRGGEAVAVDVRGSVPYEYGHIAGAVWMPLGLISQRAGELPQDKLLVMYCTCKAEETSLEAAMTLSKMGFERVAVLHGGYPAWSEAGLPTESNREPEPEVATAGTASSGGRMRPAAAVACDANQLTSFAGTITHYRRLRGKTVLRIATNAGTMETITLRHRGSDDPSRFFLIDGTPFTPKDWNRIEKRNGSLHPKMSAVAWVCSGGATVIDWRPGVTLSPGV